jgi:hypothetical protein
LGNLRLSAQIAGTGEKSFIVVDWFKIALTGRYRVPAGSIRRGAVGPVLLQAQPQVRFYVVRIAGNEQLFNH